ncbi:hypothetical protein JY460_13060 [Stenotrophomonas maltophilia]|uniref:Uncharacterized protein n=1 Tax=Stenotrophomonas maltophilia TaxID=40324 RepID=A0ABD7C2Z5_STEMA|nr:hypothetical protein [Stenotrophomonas maltophilia]MBN5089030.1 hypothetical protein [Stenotrophomonas maltophilia]QQQ42207.1 hypothetical protein JJL50_20070 [Stenotrophomonas maltophilia]
MSIGLGIARPHVARWLLRQRQKSRWRKKHCRFSTDTAPPRFPVWPTAVCGVFADTINTSLRMAGDFPAEAARRRTGFCGARQVVSHSSIKLKATASLNVAPPP